MYYCKHFNKHSSAYALWLWYCLCILGVEFSKLVNEMHIFKFWRVSLNLKGFITYTSIINICLLTSSSELYSQNLFCFQISYENLWLMVLMLRKSIYNHFHIYLSFRLFFFVLCLFTWFAHFPYRVVRGIYRIGTVFMYYVLHKWFPSLFLGAYLFFSTEILNFYIVMFMRFCHL